MNTKLFKIVLNLFFLLINLFLLVRYFEMTLGYYNPFILYDLLNLFWGKFGGAVIMGISEEVQFDILAIPILAGIELFMAWVIGMEIKKVKKPAYWSISLFSLIIINMLLFPFIV